MLMVTLSTALQAQFRGDSWEPSGNRDEDCISQFLNSNCTVTSGTIESDVIPNLQDGCPIKIKAAYTIKNCNGVLVIEIGSYIVSFMDEKCIKEAYDGRIAQRNCCGNNMDDATIGEFAGKCWQNIFEKLTGSATLSVKGVHSVVLAKKNACFSTIDVSIPASSCNRMVDNPTTGGSKSVLVNFPATNSIIHAQCTGDGCCLGVASLDNSGTIVDFTKTNVPSTSCGTFDETMFRTNFLMCPNIPYTLNSISPCEPDDCNFNLSGVYDYGNYWKSAPAAAGMPQKNEYRIISLAPIPVNDVLKVSYSGNPTSVQIYAIDGKLVETLAPSTTEVNTKHYSKGTYLFKVKFENGSTQSTKFIKE